jgi:hypothetical protein
MYPMRKWLFIFCILNSLLIYAQPNGIVIKASYSDKNVAIARDTGSFWKGLVTYPSQKPITGYIFQNIEGFESGHQSPVELNKKMGVINTKGELVIPCMYDKMIAIRAEGASYYIVCRNSRYGVLNERNEVVVPFVYDFIDICDYIPAIVRVSERGKSGLMNVVTRKWVAPAIYEQAWVASTTSAKVMKGPQVYSINVDNNKMQVVLPLQSESKRIATKSEIALFITSKDGRYGLTNANGKVIIPLQYELITYPFVNTNLLIVTKNSKKGLLSLNGKLVLEIDCDEITTGHDESYLVKRNGKYGVLSKEGVWLLPAAYELLTPAAYSDNYSLSFLLAKKNGKKGVIEITKNKQQLEFVYDDLIGFGRNLRGVEIFRDYIIAIKDGKYGMIDSNGKTLLPFIYQDLQYVNASLAIARKNDKYGLVEVNNHENVVLPFEYQFINFNNNNTLGALKSVYERYTISGKQIAKLDSTPAEIR